MAMRPWVMRKEREEVLYVWLVSEMGNLRGRTMLAKEVLAWELVQRMDGFLDDASVFVTTPDNDLTELLDVCVMTKTGGLVWSYSGGNVNPFPMWSTLLPKLSEHRRDRLIRVMARLGLSHGEASDEPGERDGTAGQ